MEDKTLGKLGGICSVLVGASYVVAGITYVLAPVEQQPTSPPEVFLPSFAQNPTALTIQYWALAVGALFALGAVLAISQVVRSVNEGWVRWTSTLATLGFSVVAVDNFRNVGFQSGRALAFVEGDAATRLALGVSGPFSLDPQGWLGFGAVGLWVLVVSLLALRSGRLRAPLPQLGIGVAIAYFLVVAGLVLSMEALIAIAAGVGGVILGPVWYVWIGLGLQRDAA